MPFNCGLSFTKSGLTETFHTLQVTAVDQANNASITRFITWQVDLSTIRTSALQAPPGLSKQSTATVIFVANKTAAFQCKLNTEPYQACMAPWTRANLPDGTYVLKVKATDVAGVSEEAPLEVTWTIDATAPEMPVLDSVANNLTNNSNYSVSWQDGGGTPDHYEVDVDLAPSFNTTMVRNFAGVRTLSQPIVPALSEGLWYYRVRAVDAAGNASAWSTAKSFTLDTQPPWAPSLNFIPDPSSDTRPMFTWQGSDDAATYRIVIATNALFQNPLMDRANLRAPMFQPIDALPDGLIYWKVSASDTAGNQSAFSLLKNFVVDITVPPTPVVNSLTSPSQNTRPIFSWSEVVGAKKYQLQIATTVSFSSILFDDATITGKSFQLGAGEALAQNGVFYWRLAALDSSSNRSGFSEAREYVVDNSAPSAPVLSDYAPNPTNDLTPTLVWSHPGAGATNFDIEIRSGANALLASQSNLISINFTPTAPLPVGIINWKVRSRDAAGNTSAFSATKSVTLSSAAAWRYRFLKDRSTWTSPSNSWSRFGAYKFTSAGTPVFLASGGNAPISGDVYMGYLLWRQNQWSTWAPINGFKANNAAVSATARIAENQQTTYDFFNGTGDNQISIWTNVFQIFNLKGDLSGWQYESREIPYPGLFNVPNVSAAVMGAIRVPNGSGFDTFIARAGAQAGLSASYLLAGASSSWVAPTILSELSMGPQAILTPGILSVPLAYDPTSKKISIMVRQNTVPAVAWWEASFDANSVSWDWIKRADCFVTLSTDPCYEIAYTDITSTLPNRPDRLVYEDGSVVLENFRNGVDVRWSTSQNAFMRASTVRPRYRLVAGTPSTDGDLNLSYFDGQSTRLFAVEDDDGAIFTRTNTKIGSEKVTLNNFGNPTVMLENATLNRYEFSASVSATSIDVAAGNGQYQSMIFKSDGTPRISFYDSGSRKLKLAEIINGNWTVQLIDNATDVGKYSSMASRSDGKGYIAYYDSTTGGLNVAVEVSVGWANYSIDRGSVTGSDLGRYADIAVGPDDFPRISYYDATNGDLKFASFDGVTWTIQVVDSIGNVGLGTSLVIDSAGRPVIAYGDATNGALKVAQWSGTSWVIETVYNGAAGTIGEAISMERNSIGTLMIAYHNQSDRDLMFAEKGLGATSWTLSTLRVTGDVGRELSLTVDALGNPHVVFYDFTNGNLLYGSRDVNWAFKVMDGDDTAGQDRGRFCSIAINPLNGAPSASYWDATEGGVYLIEGMILY